MVLPRRVGVLRGGCIVFVGCSLCAKKGGQEWAGDGQGRDVRCETKNVSEV